jgi:hypothetical protein
MSEFVDSSGNAWQVRIDVSTIKRVRDKYGIDLSKVMSSQSELTRLADDVVLLVDVLFALVSPQAETRKVSAEDFAHLLAGDTIESATNALMEAIIDFFPQSRRVLLRQLWEKLKAYDQQNMTKAKTAIDELTFGDSFTSMPVTQE